MVAARELRTGDQLIDPRALGGISTFGRATLELGRDLTPWVALRKVGGSIIAVDSWETPVAIMADTPAAPVGQCAEDARPLFVPPQQLAEVLALALSYRRSHRVSHGTNHSDRASETFSAGWRPSGCEVETALTLSWLADAAGKFKFSSGSVRGIRTEWAPVSIARAKKFLTGELCLSHGYPYTANHPTAD